MRRSDRNERTLPEKLSDYLDGVLPAEERQELEETFERNPELRAMLDGFRRLSGLAEDEVPDDPLPFEAYYAPIGEQIAEIEPETEPPVLEPEVPVVAAEPVGRRPRWVIPGLAALILLTVGLVWWRVRLPNEAERIVAVAPEGPTPETATAHQEPNARFENPTSEAQDTETKETASLEASETAAESKPKTSEMTTVSSPTEPIAGIPTAAATPRKSESPVTTPPANAPKTAARRGEVVRIDEPPIAATATKAESPPPSDATATKGGSLPVPIVSEMVESQTAERVIKPAPTLPAAAEKSAAETPSVTESPPTEELAPASESSPLEARAANVGLAGPTFALLGTGAEAIPRAIPTPTVPYRMRIVRGKAVLHETDVHLPMKLAFRYGDQYYEVELARGGDDRWTLTSTYRPDPNAQEAEEVRERYFDPNARNGNGPTMNEVIRRIRLAQPFAQQPRLFVEILSAGPTNSQKERVQNGME